MKKLMVLMMVMSLMAAVVGCGNDDTEKTADETEATAGTSQDETAAEGSKEETTEKTLGKKRMRRLKKLRNQWTWTR